MKKNLTYKGAKVNSFGIPILSHGKKSEVRHGELQGLENKYHQYHYFNFSFEKDSPKNLIVMYDIPHEKKKERDWFRRHLKKFNYIMIQKSVWVGPSPLPKDFLDYVKSIGILSQLKTFKLAKPYTGEENVYKNALGL
ncbi:MAG: CRISPR-associated endonuclease Cas2 [bacterium]